MNDKKYIIWSNVDLDYEDWRETLEENYPEVSEDRRVEIMYEENDSNLLDERYNLNIKLKEPILIIADIGRRKVFRIQRNRKRKYFRLPLYRHGLRHMVC